MARRPKLTNSLSSILRFQRWLASAVLAGEIGRGEGELLEKIVRGMLVTKRQQHVEGELEEARGILRAMEAAVRQGDADEEQDRRGLPPAGTAADAPPDDHQE